MMGVQMKKEKKKMSPETIYNIMQWLPIIVSAVFFIINVSKKNTAAMIAIGICLAVFVAIAVVVKVKKVVLYKKAFVMSLTLPTLVFMISLFSGASYSDDFPLLLAVIGLTGMFLEPKYTLAQMILADIYIVLMYVIHPEKSGGTSQYILCTACFMLASALFCLVIKRGRAFIETSEEKAKEAEALLQSIRDMGAELQQDFEASSQKIEHKTAGLQQGSLNIEKGAEMVSDSCDVVQDKLRETGEQIRQLNDEVKQFEAALLVNKNNMESMTGQVDTVSEIINETGTVFRTMEEQMHQIVGIAKQISDISFNLTILSLNASVEAAHAGEFGAGFEVVAGEMRALSESSSGFSEQVSDVVKGLLLKVENASQRISDSERAFLQSEKTMTELADSFDKLNKQFETLYANIEGQTQNVSQMNYIFGDLNNKVSDMQSSSRENKEAVDGIAEAMMEFSGDVGKIVKNTQSI